MPSTRGLRGRDLDEHEVDEIVKAMIADQTLLGLRRAEVAALNLHDVDLGTGEVLIWQGKRRKERGTYVGESTLDAQYD